jgi:hypothetical protein
LEVESLTIQKADDGPGKGDELTAAHDAKLRTTGESRQGVIPGDGLVQQQ